MSQIKYQIPYEVTVFAKDLGSGKPISNRWYYRCGAQVGSPPAYGADIAGGSDNATFLLNFIGAYNLTVLTLLNHNYAETMFQSQAIVGKRYSTPLQAIASLVPGTPVTVNVGSPHGLVSGNTVIISGVTSPAVVNGTWVVNVTSPTQFTLVGSSIAAVWSGDGMVQLVQGALEFLYADKQTSFVGLLDGGIAGDSLPLFATASIRRLNVGIGRHYRSRVSLSPMSEADVVDGSFTTAQRALAATAFGSFLVPILNGGSDTGSRLMYHQAISKSLAFAQASPFAFNGFCQNVTGFQQQINCGSLTRRKPKLTAIIT